MTAPTIEPHTGITTPAGLTTLQPLDDPRVAGWLVPGYNCTEVGYEVVLRSFCDIGICEQPEGSNMGRRIEAMTRRMGLTPPQYWCAVWVCCVLADRGCLFPVNGASCDEWIRFSHLCTLRDILTASPGAQKFMIGGQILFGTRGRGDHGRSASALRLSGWDAVHIGTITRITKTRVYTCEGNRGYAGGVTNNGEWVSNDVCKRTDVIGIIPLRQAADYTPQKHTIQRVAL
jgi:hypothetical protein